ncbi:hypothetical protein BZA77DRAFT_371759 [Pyronema omphalodes]|nr:hypothetical protein BZA77DRAFT_371759 [Pyronema omphalodes]
MNTNKCSSGSLRSTVTPRIIACVPRSVPILKWFKKGTTAGNLVDITATLRNSYHVSTAPIFAMNPPLPVLQSLLCLLLRPTFSAAMPSTDSNTDDAFSTGPADPDWDMWIEEPSTAKDGPSAKETLIAGKLDWEIPVQWSGVTAEKQAQAIRRLRFWMGWTWEKAETHLKKMAGKWFSEKKRQAADRENPERVKQSTPALITGLPAISAAAPRTERPSTTTNDTPLFLLAGDESDSDDDMAWDAEHAVIEAVLNEMRSTNFESLTNPDSTVDVADDGITEGPQDVPSQTTVPFLGTRRPGPDFSRLRLTGSFFASWTTGVIADATVASAVLPNGSSTGDGSETAGTSPEEA